MSPAEASLCGLFRAVRGTGGAHAAPPVKHQLLLVLHSHTHMTRWYVIFIHYIAYLGLCGDVSVVLYSYFFTEFLRAQHDAARHDLQQVWSCVAVPHID